MDKEKTLRIKIFEFASIPPFDIWPHIYIPFFLL